MWLLATENDTTHPGSSNNVPLISTLHDLYTAAVDTVDSQMSLFLAKALACIVQAYSLQ